MKKVAIIGGGGFGREVAWLIDDINQRQPTWEVIGFFDDGLEKGSIINGLPVLGSIVEINTLREPTGVVFALGNPETKRITFGKVNSDQIFFPTLIHPSVISSNAGLVKIGEGSIICAGCVLTVNIQIGRHVILNLCTTVGHDAVIEDFSSVMPSVNISGEVHIEERVFIGTGAKLVNQLRVGRNTTVGAGAVVVADLPPNCVAVGVPAKPIKTKS